MRRNYVFLIFAAAVLSLLALLYSKKEFKLLKFFSSTKLNYNESQNSKKKLSKTFLFIIIYHILFLPHKLTVIIDPNEFPIILLAPLRIEL